MSEITSNVFIKIPGVEGTCEVPGFEKCIKVSGTAFPEYDKPQTHSGGGPVEGKKVFLTLVDYLVVDQTAINNIMKKFKPGQKIKEMIEVVLVKAPTDGEAIKLKHAHYYNCMLQCGAVKEGRMNLKINAGFIALGVYEVQDKASQLLGEVHIDVGAQEVLDQSMTAESAAKSAQKIW